MKRLLFLFILALPLFADGPLNIAILNQSGATDGQSICWSLANDIWEPCTVSAVVSDGDKGDITVSGSGTVWTVDSGAISANEISDITITTASTGEVLRYNGSAWVDAQLGFSDLSGTATDGQIPDNITISLAATATALAANGGNCGTGLAPEGVDASGAVENCNDFILETELDAISELQTQIADATLLTTADEGSGNGIDADTVDGLEGAAFLQLSGGTMTGDLLSSAGIEIEATQLEIFVRKGSVGTITAGQVVYVSGYNGGTGFVEVELADADGGTTMPALGVAQETITNVAEGRVVSAGKLLDVDTSCCTAGSAVYVSTTAGAFTSTIPTGETADIQKVGIVLRSNAVNGVLDVVGAGRSNDTPNLDAANFFLGNASNQAATVTMSGDATIDNAGVVTVASISGTSLADLLTEAELDTISELQTQIADATLLTTADEGSGNGIDADTVDGVEEAAFLLIDGTRAMTGSLIADEQGVEFTESDDVVTCAAGDYWIRADLSETTLKKCLNGTETVLDTTGGAPAFSDITGATNTTAAMVVGTGASLGVSGSGTIAATSGDSATAFFSSGQIEAARGGTGGDSSASTGVARTNSGTWSYDAGISHLAASTSADLAGVLSNETGSGVAVFGTSPTVTTPLISGKIDGDAGAVNDDDCTGEQGFMWYDDTDFQWEICNADSGTPIAIGAGGSSINLEENNVEVISAANLTGLDFLGADFDVTDDTNEGDIAIAAALTRDTEWDTAAEINAATTDDDFVNLASAQTITGQKTFGTASNTFMTVEGVTDDAIETIFAVVNPTTIDKTITFPNATGTVPLLDNAVTFTNKTISGDSNTLSANTNATDCTAEPGSVAGQLCHEEDADTFWVYDGTAWDQIGAGGAEVNNLETTIPPNVLDNEVYVGTGGATGAWTALNTNGAVAFNGTSFSQANLSTDLTGTLPVGNGGTGATTLTDGGLLLGSGTGAITALGVATNGQIPIGDGTTDPVLATITAEAGNEITVTNGAGSIQLDVNEANVDITALGGTLDIDSVGGQANWGTAATKETADLTISGVEVDFEAGGSEGFPRLAQSTTPPGTECDAAAEAGRLYFDSDADTDGSVFVCTGAGGWKDIDDDGGAGGFTSFNIDGDNNSPQTITDGNEALFVGGVGITTTAAVTDQVTFDVASEEAGFLNDGAAVSLTCGASNQGKMQVMDNGNLEWCDGATTSVLQYAALGASDGDALAGDNATNFFDAGNLELARLPVGTANQLIKTNAGATAQEHATLAAEAGNEISVSFGVGTITLDVNEANLDLAVLGGTLDVPNGGTGATTLTDGGLLLGSGTGAITALGVATNGQIPIGDGTTDPVLANITAEAGNEITVTNGAGSIELDVNEANVDITALGGTLDIDSVGGQANWGTAATKETADLIINGVEVDYEAGGSEGFPRLAQSTTPPIAACDAAAEAGRLYYDTDADTDGSVFVCRGAAGWKEIDDDGAGGGFTSFDLSGDTGTDETVTDGQIAHFAGGDGVVTDVAATDQINIQLATSEAGAMDDGGVTSLTCGASATGKFQIMDDGTIEACDGNATSVLQTFYPGTSTEAYRKTFSSSTTLTITNAEHGIGHEKILWSCDDDGGATHTSITPQSVAVNDTTFAVTFTFNPATSGGCTVAGNGASNGGMTSFTLAGDGGANQTISGGDTLDVEGGAGIATTGTATDIVSVATASEEVAFLNDGGVTSLTCGASAGGKMQVMDDGTLEYCDGAATSVLQSGVLSTTDFGASVDLGSEVAGTLPVGNGGTGATTLTDGGLLLGSGTGAITALGVASNGQIPIGDGTTDPVLANITAEAGNEITVTNGAGSIQLDVNEANVDLANLGGTLGSGQIATSLKEDTKCLTLFDETTDIPATTDIPSFWINRMGAITLTEINCESDSGTATINMQRDDGAAADILASSLTCSAGGATATPQAAEDNVALGEEIDFVLVTSPAGTNRINACFTFTID